MSKDPLIPKFPMNDCKMLIGGELVDSESGRFFETVNPVNEEVIGRVPRGSAKDIETAVEAAEKAQPAWAALTMKERAQYLYKLADALRERAEEILHVEVVDTGNSIYLMKYDVGMGIDTLMYYAGLGYEIKGDTVPSTPGNLHITVREPYGVVGRIIPFNHPILFAIGRVAPPLMAGNCLIIKPSRETPLSACVFAEILSQVLPAGVVNVVTGFGSEAGDALVRHPRVKRLALVGSVETGMAIQHAASEVGVKNISLELGGKNPMIVFPDADLEGAVNSAVIGMNFAWQGQSCGSTSRVFVHESIYDQFVPKVVDIISSLKLDDPLDWDTRMGPINNKAQFKKVNYYIETGKKEGATCLTGGKRPEGDKFKKGYWVEPTVFGDVTPEMTIAREEIFGPVLSILKWKDVDEVMEVANSLNVGLSGSIWTQDLNTAIKMAKRIETGYVWINDSAAHYPATPFGGYKNSGIGREEGIDDLLSYTEEKTIHFKLS